MELKSGIEIKGNLLSIDKNLNLVLNNIEVDSKYIDYFSNIKEGFIRGNTIKYIGFTNNIDLNNLQNTCREEYIKSKELK